MLYAIGDIHGRLDLLTALYSKIIDDVKRVNDPKGATIIFLGDMIDRGPDSKGVLDFIMNISDYDHENVKHIMLKGNHELMMCDSWHGTYPTATGMWLYNGGLNTLHSFNIVENIHHIAHDKVLEPYVNWCEHLPLLYQQGNYTFCHSGLVDFTKPFEDQEVGLLWGRPYKSQYIGIAPNWIVHGHTAQHNCKPLIGVNTINVDVACGYPNNENLCAVTLPYDSCRDDEIRFIQLQP